MGGVANMVGGLLGGGGGGGLGGIGSMIGGMFGGPLGAMIGQVAGDLLGSIVNDTIKDAGRQAGMSPRTIADAQQEAGCSDCNQRETMDKFQQETGASDSDMGHVSREVDNLKDLFNKLMKEMMLSNGESGSTTGPNKKKGGSCGAEGAAGGKPDTAGAESPNGTPGSEDVTVSDHMESGNDWFMAVAKALAKCAQRQADTVKDKADELSQASKTADTDRNAAVGKDANSEEAAASKGSGDKQMELQTELSAESQKMGFLMQAIQTAIGSLGKALETAARPSA